MRSKLSFIVFSLLVAPGCGDGRMARVPVSGQVLIDGKPLAHGQILFVPPVGRASLGKLDVDGRFKLTCFDDGDGAVLGSHRLAITAAEPLSALKTRWYAPKKLADHRTSGLTQEIIGPMDNLIIKISWEGGHEFVEVEEGSEDSGPLVKRLK